MLAMASGSGCMAQVQALAAVQPVHRLDAQLGWVALVSKMGSPALYSSPERADLVFTKCSMGRQYLEQLDRQGGLADAAGGRAAGRS